MSIFRRHFKSSVALIGYYLVVSFLVYHFFLAPTPAEPVCDFTPILIFPTVIVGMVLSIAYLVKFFNSPDAVKNDYLLFAGITAFPLVAFGGLIIIW